MRQQTVDLLFRMRSLNTQSVCFIWCVQVLVENKKSPKKHLAKKKLSKLASRPIPAHTSPRWVKERKRYGALRGQTGFGCTTYATRHLSPASRGSSWQPGTLRLIDFEISLTIAVWATLHLMEFICCSFLCRFFVAKSRAHVKYTRGQFGAIWNFACEYSASPADETS